MDKLTPRKRTPLAPLQYGNFLLDKASLCKEPSAYHLTPLESRKFRQKRAKEFGLTPPPLDTFLLNQSLPSTHQDPEDGNVGLSMGDTRRCSIDKFSGNALDSISYSPTKVSHNGDLRKGRHLNGSFFHKVVEGSSEISGLHPYAQNPKKAVITIDSQTTEILTANKAFFCLLGLSNIHSPSKLSDYLLSPDDQYLFSDTELKSNGELVLFSGKVMDLITRGDMILPVSVWARRLCSEGDFRCLVVMEPVERITGTVKFDSTGEVITCDKSFASLYGYTSLDDVAGKNMRELIPSLEYGLKSSEIDSKGDTKQCVTGRTVDGFIFPLSIQIKPCSSDVETEEDSVKSSECTFYEGVVWVFNNISGLITLLPDGTIHSCNTNFSLMLFGYSQSDLVGKNISMLIPSFHDDVEFLDTDSMALPPFDDDDDSNAKYGTSDGRTTADSMGHDLPRPVNPMGRPLDDEYMQSTAFCSSYTDESSPSALSDKLENVPETEQPENATETTCSDAPKLEELSASSSQYGSSSKHLSCSESQDTLHSCTNSIAESDANANFYEYESDVYDSESSAQSDYEECDGSDVQPPEKTAASPVSNDNTSSRLTVSENREQCPSECGRSPKVSTPNFKVLSESSFQSIPEGDFVGMGRHKDGTDLAIEYYIKKVILDDGKCLYCLWVSRDPDEIKDCSPVSKVHYSNSHSEASKSSQSKSEKSTSETSVTSESSVLADCDYTAGAFSENYTILQHLRKGAFGCIKKAYRNSDGLLVITKFIRKSEVYEDSWVNDNKLNQKVPLEISLLITLDHPNIVKVLAVFQNDLCFQMVMEKHGCGMDLFEFIERDPKLDEALASYIFRQIVSALLYLHDLSVLHRDIKDENVIINEKFHIKLIDFGSATFMGNELFSTFCGTMEYCSPEVIRGHKYRGPELEMFSLGVTLYTLIFGENPFIGAEEILKGHYKISSKISEDLTNLISDLLEPDPTKRCTLLEVSKHPWIQQIVPIGLYDFASIVHASAEELSPTKYFDLRSLEADTSTESDISFLEKKVDDIDLNSLACSSTESEINGLSSPLNSSK